MSRPHTAAASQPPRQPSVVRIAPARSVRRSAAKKAQGRAALELQGKRLAIGLLSEMWHFWMNPVMRLEGRVEASELPLLPPEDSAADLLDSFRALWAGARAKATGDGRALRRVTVRLLLPRFALLGLWNVLDASCNFLQPIIIAALVRDLRLATFDRLGWDFALAVLLALASLGAAMSIQQVLWGGARVGMRAKLALSSAVYARPSPSRPGLRRISAGSPPDLPDLR